MLQIIKASILSYLRNTKSLMFNLFFPIFLILILGLTLENNFKTSAVSEKEEIEVLYLDNGSTTSKEVLSALDGIDGEIKFNLVKVESKEIAKQMVRARRSVFVELDGNTINFYSNERYKINSSIVYPALRAIKDSTNLSIEIYKINPDALSNNITKSEEDIFDVELISQERFPSARDYYGVAELGLMIFYYFQVPLHYLKQERKKNIKDRIKVTGITSVKYYFASFIGYTIATYATLCASYLIAKFILGVNYGDSLLILPLAALPFITLVISLGIFLAIVLKEEERAEVIGSSVIVPVLCFLGGGYVVIGDGGNSIFNFITHLSPLRWFNNGIFRYIYGGTSNNLYLWIAIGYSVSAIILIMIYFIARREDLVNG